MKLFHRHNWTMRLGSRMGKILNVRYCKCGHFESQMYDYSTKCLVWVPGNFMEDVGSPVFIIAESQDALKQKLPAVPQQAGYYHAKTIEDLEKMKQWSHPRFLLGYDYKETVISDTPDFIRLMETGHF